MAGDEFGKVVAFRDVFEAEIRAINQRRQERGLSPIGLEPEPSTQDELNCRPQDDADLVGLSLSGGGIRSAAFCLGALQALHEAKVLDRVDYLSTVSGGGYIGGALTSALHANPRGFPFDRQRDGVEEPPALQHLRNYSRYLAPNGALDWLANGAVYARGLAANVVLIAPVPLLCAVITILSNPVAGQWRPNLFGFPVHNAFPFTHFVVTAYVAAGTLLALAAWALLRSRPRLRSASETEGAWSGIAHGLGALMAIVLVSAFFELQPLLLQRMFTGVRWFEGFAGWLQGIAAALAPLAGIVALLGRRLGEFTKSATESRRKRVQAAGLAARVAIYAAALFLPVLLWALYLQLSYWGICNPSGKNAFSFTCTREGTNSYIVPALYGVLALMGAALSLFLRPNANSLHALYRDRLGRAFLFVEETPSDVTRERSRIALSALSSPRGPYQLFNAALNVQGSKVANRRGRNADFFILSPLFIGSAVTGYVRTTDVERMATDLDAASAIAISGAAASSNMGAATIKPLTPTLALLNIRLGYWLRNPRMLAATAAKKVNPLANFYILAEILGFLNENRMSVYLTDGGHIENLGLYELLRRRCKVIIALDAEADARMGFGSFNVLQRFALIDLNTRIDLAWEEIADVSRAAGAEIDAAADTAKRKGPHCAVGIISYPGDRKGVLVYIKSSITGDEDDAIFHYKKRYPDFPHETTLDQMFSEEQFECYRDLGHHAASRLFGGEDAYAHRDPLQCPELLDALATLRRVFPEACLKEA